LSRAFENLEAIIWRNRHKRRNTMRIYGYMSSVMKDVLSMVYFQILEIADNRLIHSSSTSEG